MTQAVLFDLDGTLLDRTSSLRIYLYRLAERVPDFFEDTPFDEFMARFMELDDNGYKARSELFRQLGDAFGLPPGTGAALLNDYEHHFRHDCVAFPKAHETLSTLRQEGLRLGLVTNGATASQRAKIAGLGMAGYFDAILISEAEGLRKPDPRIFQRALDSLGASPQDAVMVGDNPEADIQGARDCGMKAIWKRDHYWEPPEVVDAVVDDLEELPQVVRNLFERP